MRLSAAYYQVVVHIDEAALAGSETGSSQLPVEYVRRVCCDGSVVPKSLLLSGVRSGRVIKAVVFPVATQLFIHDDLGMIYPYT